MKGIDMQFQTSKHRNGNVVISAVAVFAMAIALGAWALMLIIGVLHGTIAPDTVTGTLSFPQALGLYALLFIFRLKYEKND